MWLIKAPRHLVEINGFSIYQTSGKQFSRVLIGSRNLEYPWIFTVLLTERKMARRFAKVSEEIVAINETASRCISTTIHLPFGG